MNKEIIVGEEAISLIKNTIIKLCDYVALTLGPKGRNAIIDTDYSEAFITNDGVTIAKNLEFGIREEAIAKIIKETSIKTCDKVGDGTTTSLVLLKAIYLESLKYLEKGISPFLIKEKLNNKVKFLCEELVKNSKKCTSLDIEHIASTSSGDKNIGLLIRKCLENVSKLGKIVIEESVKEQTEVEIIEGMFLDNGVVSSFLINGRNKEEIIDNPYMLITDYKIESIAQISNVIEKLNKKSIVIIAESFEEEVIEYFSSLKTNKILNIVCIDAPNYAENKTDILEDICVLTNSKLISPKYGDNLEKIDLKNLGKCEKIKISRENTIIYNKHGKEVLKRVEYINKILNKEDNSFQKEILETRLANLSGGIAVIYVGAKTKSEMILSKMRIEDAICASKVALCSGVSLGGGLEYYNLSKFLKKKSIENSILKESLQMPMKQIIINSGLDAKNIIQHLNSKNRNIGFDAKNNRFLDMNEYGIIDPTYVLIESLKNAVSIATILLTTSLIIVCKNKEIVKNVSEIL